MGFAGTCRNAGCLVAGAAGIAGFYCGDWPKNTLSLCLEESSSMRIAQIAPLTEAIPPKLYGGTERVIYWLTEELVALGHHVTLFASGDSRTAATLAPSWPRALRLDGPVRDPC